MYPQIIVTGDSIAQLSFRAGGYGSLLVDKYQGKLDVLNRGMGGYNSRQLLQKIKTDFPTRALLYIVHIGTNDSAINALQTVPLDEFTDNLRQIISHLPRVILLTPSTLDPPTCEAFEDTFQIPPALRSPRLPDNTRKYVDACKAVAAEANVPCVDCFALHQDALNAGDRLGDIFEDGLHYSPKGYSSINKAILDIIGTMPDLKVESMPNGFTDFWLYGNCSPDAKWIAELFGEIRRRAEEHFAAKPSPAPIDSA